ncbi:MAG: hypothetical protein CL678_11570 [Bdellovibrionaceae bacterium]|nr:hypothetical protein [Pseudobdellovibrionaceae bacterium]
MTLDLSKVLVFRCYRKPDGRDTKDNPPDPSYGLNLNNNNSIRVNPEAPPFNSVWAESTKNLHQVPWIKIIKKKNKLPTVELVSRVMYRLSTKIDPGTSNTSRDQARLSYFHFWKNPASTPKSYPVQYGNIYGFPLFNVERTPKNWPVWHGGLHPMYTKTKLDPETNSPPPNYYLLEQLTYDSNGVPQERDLPTGGSWNSARQKFKKYYPPNTIDLSGQKNIIIIDFRGRNMRWTDGCGNDFCGNVTGHGHNVKLKYLILRIKSSNEEVEEEKYKPFEPDMRWPEAHPTKKDYWWGSGYGSGYFSKWYRTIEEDPPNKKIYNREELQYTIGENGIDRIGASTYDDIRNPAEDVPGSDPKGFLENAFFKKEFWVTYTFTCDIIGPYEALDFSTKWLYTNDPDSKWGKSTHFNDDKQSEKRSSIFPQWVSIHDLKGNDGQDKDVDGTWCDNDNYEDLYAHINIWPKPDSIFENITTSTSTRRQTKLVGGLHLAGVDDTDEDTNDDVNLFRRQYNGTWTISGQEPDVDGLLNDDVTENGIKVFDISYCELRNGYADSSPLSPPDNSFNYKHGSRYRINNLLWCSLRSPRHLDISCGDYNSLEDLSSINQEANWPKSRRYIPNFCKLTKYGWWGYQNAQLSSSSFINQTIFPEVMRHRGKCRGGGYAKNPNLIGWNENNQSPTDGWNVIDLPRRTKNPYYSSKNPYTGKWNSLIDPHTTQYVSRKLNEETNEYELSIIEDDYGLNTDGIQNPELDLAMNNNGQSNYFDIYYKLLVPPNDGNYVSVEFTFGLNESSVITFFRYEDMDGDATPTGKKQEDADRANEKITLKWTGKPNDVSGEDAEMKMMKIRIFDIASGSSSHQATFNINNDNKLFGDLNNNSKKNYEITANVWQLFLVNPKNTLNNNNNDDGRPENSHLKFNQNEKVYYDLSYTPVGKPIYSYNNIHNGQRGMNLSHSASKWMWYGIQPYHKIKDLSWNIRINANTLLIKDADENEAIDDHAKSIVILNDIYKWDNIFDQEGGGTHSLMLDPLSLRGDDNFIINIDSDQHRGKIFEAIPSYNGPLIWQNDTPINGWETNDPFKNYMNHPFTENFLNNVVGNDTANQVKIPHPDLFDQEHIILDYWKWYLLLNKEEHNQGNNPGSIENEYWTDYQNQIQTLSFISLVALTTKMKYILVKKEEMKVIKDEENINQTQSIKVIGYPKEGGGDIYIKINKVPEIEDLRYLNPINNVNANTEQSVNLVEAITETQRTGYSFIDFGKTKITLKGINENDKIYGDQQYNLFYNLDVFRSNNEIEIIVNRVNIGVPQGIFGEKYYFLSDDNKTIIIGWNNDGQGYDFNTNDGDIYWTITKINQQTHSTSILLSAKTLSRNNSGQYEFIDNDLRIYDKYQYKIVGEYRWKEIDYNNNNKEIDLTFSIGFDTETIFVCKNNQFPYGRYNTTSTNLKLYRPLLLTSKNGQCDKVDENGNTTGKCVGGECLAEYTPSRSRGGTRNIYANTTNQLTKKETYVFLSKSKFRPFR